MITASFREQSAKLALHIEPGSECVQRCLQAFVSPPTENAAALHNECWLCSITALLRCEQGLLRPAPVCVEAVAVPMLAVRLQRRGYCRASTHTTLATLLVALAAKAAPPTRSGAGTRAPAKATQQAKHSPLRSRPGSSPPRPWHGGFTCQAFARGRLSTRSGHATPLCRRRPLNGR